jgi:glucose-1-phosphate adenylyltransferase
MPTIRFIITSLDRRSARSRPGSSLSPGLGYGSFQHEGGRAGRVVSSVVSSGANVSGGLVGESVLAPGVRVGEGASIKRAVLLHHARIGPRAVIRHTIVDENAVVPGEVQVGVDKQHDRARGLLVSPGGVTIVGKGQQVPP